MTYPLFTLFPKSGSPKRQQNHSMPTLPSVNHYREESLPSLPPQSYSRTISPFADPPATDPASTYSNPPTTFSGSVVGSISRRNRRSFAAIAQRTSSAFASLSTIGTPTIGTTTLRSSASNSSLAKQTRPASTTPLTPPFSDEDTYDQLSGLSRSGSPEPQTIQKRRLTLQRVPTPPLESRPVHPGLAPAAPPKMHQTSSRLLRMTEDERPFTKVGWKEQDTICVGNMAIGGLHWFFSLLL